MSALTIEMGYDSYEQWKFRNDRLEETVSILHEKFPKLRDHESIFTEALKELAPERIQKIRRHWERKHGIEPVRLADMCMDLAFQHFLYCTGGCYVMALSLTPFGGLVCELGVSHLFRLE